jgi:hypothetical protein
MGNRSVKRDESGVRKWDLGSIVVILELDFREGLAPSTIRSKPVHCIFVQDVLLRT